MKKSRSDFYEKCRGCRHLAVIGTGSQILMICKVTRRDVSYEHECDCGAYTPKETVK